MDLHRVRLRGVVTRADSLDGTVVQVGRFGVWVRPVGDPPRPGDEVKAVGFPDLAGFVPDLNDAVLLPAGELVADLV